MWKFFSRRRAEPCEIVYVVANPHEFRKWRDTQPSDKRYENIANEACAWGLVPLYPPAKFVVLPGADINALFCLKHHGFPVEIPIPPKPPPDPRQKEIEHWIAKLENWERTAPKAPPRDLLREQIGCWHWRQHFKALHDGDAEKARHHKTLADLVRNRDKADKRIHQLLQQAEKDRVLLELLDSSQAGTKEQQQNTVD